MRVELISLALLHRISPAYVAIKGKYFFQLMYFLHEKIWHTMNIRRALVKKTCESVDRVTGMSAGR